MVQSTFVNLLLLMAMAVVTLWLFRRIRLPAVLAYLGCGVLAGPEVLGLWSSADEMHHVAELGIVFLLFSLGLEFSLPRMLAMRKQVFGLGLWQTLITGFAFFGAAYMAGLETNTAVVIGGMVALSSTAVVIKQSADLGILNTARARMSISILLFQDLAVVPLLIVIPMLADNNDGALLPAIAFAVLKGGLVLVVLMSAGKWVLPRVFNEVARTRTDELFVMTTLLVTLMAAGLTYWFGLSMALGAFLAGMMLGESQYRHQLEADIRPFRDILMGLFFITLGMQLDLSVLVERWYWVLGGLMLIMFAKALIIRMIAAWYKTPSDDAWGCGIKLCQLGEFSFVLAALANQNGLLSSELQSLMLAIGIISMGMTPWLIEKSQMLSRVIVNAEDTQDLNSELQDAGLKGHAIIFGYGRVGQSVSRLLKVEAIPYVALDFDPIRVKEARSAGEPVFFGDARQKDILRSIGMLDAKLAVITFDALEPALSILETVRELNPSLPVIVRTRKDNNLEELEQAGATQVVPEILEGSLMLTSQVMHLCGVPMSRILKRVVSERKNHYGNLHGFFPGEATDMNPQTQNQLEFMHAIILPPNAWACGRTLATLELARLRISLKGLRRDNQELADPDGDIRLKANDVLVISGKPRRVERAERYILNGP